MFDDTILNLLKRWNKKHNFKGELTKSDISNSIKELSNTSDLETSDLEEILPLYRNVLLADCYRKQGKYDIALEKMKFIRSLSESLYNTNINCNNLGYILRTYGVPFEYLADKAKMQKMKEEQPEDYTLLLRYIKQLAKALEGIRYIYIMADTIISNINKRKELNLQGSMWCVSEGYSKFDSRIENLRQLINNELLEALNIPKNTPLDNIVKMLENNEIERK